MAQFGNRMYGGAIPGLLSGFSDMTRPAYNKMPPQLGGGGAAFDPNMMGGMPNAHGPAFNKMSPGTSSAMPSDQMQMQMQMQKQKLMSAVQPGGFGNYPGPEQLANGGMTRPAVQPGGFGNYPGPEQLANGGMTRPAVQPGGFGNYPGPEQLANGGMTRPAFNKSPMGGGMPVAPPGRGQPYVPPGGQTNYPGTERPMMPTTGLGGTTGAVMRPPGTGFAGVNRPSSGVRPGTYYRPSSTIRGF